MRFGDLTHHHHTNNSPINLISIWLFPNELHNKFKILESQIMYLGLRIIYIISQIFAICVTLPKFKETNVHIFNFKNKKQKPIN